MDQTITTRRGLLKAVLLGAGVAVSGCTNIERPDDEPTAATRSSSPGGRAVLVAYLSRTGENYWNGGRRRLTVGNTQLVAETVGRLIGCNVHRIDERPRHHRPRLRRFLPGRHSRRKSRRSRRASRRRQ